MAHEIVDGQIAWTGQMPWHGLGAKMDEDASVDEWIKAAKLDWEVHPKPLFFDTEEGPEQITERAAFVRSTDNKVMGIASPAWTPVQNRDMIEFMHHYTRAGGAKMEVVGALNDGKTIWGLARLGHSFEVRPGDRSDGFLLIAGSHAPGKSTKVATTSVRVVCANTMAASEGREEINYRQTHRGAFNFEAAKEAVAMAHEDMAELEKRCKILDKIKLSTEDAIKKVFVPVFEPSIAEDKEAMAQITEIAPRKICDLADAWLRAPGATPDTAWGAMNAITFYLDHMHGRSSESRFSSSTAGGWGTKKKLEAEKLLLELA